MLARRHSEDAASNPCRELAYFVTTGIVISAFALPIVLARAEVTVSPTTPAPDTVTTTISPNTTTTTMVSIDLGRPPSLTNLLADHWGSLWFC